MDRQPFDDIAPTRRRSRAVLIAVLCWVLGLALLAGAIVVARGDEPAEQDGAPRPVPVGNVQITPEDDEALIRTSTTPVAVANPRNPDHYAVGYRIERPAYSCAVATSLDAGSTWRAGQITLPPGAERCYAPSVAFDGAGTLHLAFLTLAGVGNVPSGGWLTRSQDGGLTFGPPRQVLGGQRFMMRLAVDQAAAPARVFLTWVEPTAIGFLQMTPPSPVMIAASTDGGATFGPPVRVSPANRERVGAPVPVAGARGTVHVVYLDYRGDVFDYANQPGTYDDTFEVVVATSSDGGRSFSESVVDAAMVPTEPFLVFTPPFPAIATDARRGTVHVAWADGRAGEPQVLLSSSTDGGRSWGRPVRADDASARALLPQVAVADNGRLDVAYAAVLPGGGQPTEVRMTSSDDSGATFGPVARLNNPFPREWLPENPRRVAGRDLGSALALVSQTARAYVLWPDTRKGSPESLRVDIVGAPVRATDTSAPRPPSPVA